MSGIEGIEEFLGKLEKFGQALDTLVYAQYDKDMRDTQAEAVALIPVDTGKAKAALASAEALKRDKAQNGESRWTFGLTTTAIQKAAYYLFWIEFGRKASNGGDTSGAEKTGRTRSGRKRRGRKRRRAVAAMAARPWFRPARDRLFEKLRQRSSFEKNVSAAKREAGLADGS